jgi:hypothetical protein
LIQVSRLSRFEANVPRCGWAQVCSASTASWPIARTAPQVP